MTSYNDFLESASQLSGRFGFEPIELHDFLFPFQRDLVDWSLRKGRAAIFADCGLGKTPMQLVWADNVVRKTNKPVLIVAPLAVSAQTVREGEKFGIEVRRSDDGTLYNGIITTNYERIHFFNPSDFAGTVCDESSAIKAFHGKRREEITDFMRKQKYRLLATATAAPNDWIELGTSSEALGELNRTDMLSRFFKNDEGSAVAAASGRNTGYANSSGHSAGWRLKGHAHESFWRWVASWSRALRMPSDMGYDDADFVLPALNLEEHLVEASTLADGMLFALPAVGLHEQREESRRTLTERCERAASLVNDTGEPAIVWCHLNDEGNMLEDLIPDAQQVAGSDSIEHKEQTIIDFIDGRLRVLISKPRIFGWGLNLHHCAHMTFFPTHSYEAYYQCVRRCWRFGQKRPVKVDIVTTKGGRKVMDNLQRKSELSARMFESLIQHMNESLTINRSTYKRISMEVPTWMNARS